MFRWLSFSLLALVAGCAAPPADLDVSRTRPTEQSRYVVSLRPPATPPAINQIHSWTIGVATPNGVPVRSARIAVDGGMPQHGHGLPTKPRVTRELGDGAYLMEGMKFSMTGWWEIKLAIDAAEGADKVTFNTVVHEVGTASRDRWTAEQVSVLASMRLSELPPQPEDPSNAVANLPAAAALGKQLFNDTRLSGNGEVSCASCHAPEKQFQDGVPLGRGVGTGKRRTMPIVGVAYSPWLFWDGRKDSMWSQALGPLEDSAEHGGNRARYAHHVRTHYKAEYEAVFGPLSDLSSVPAEAGPLGTAGERAAWQRLDAETRDTASRVFANIGKAIAAYERTLRYGESRFDRYAQGIVDGDVGAQESLSEQEVRGLRLFIGKGQCATCHNGPLLTDQHFHNTGVPARDPKAPDRGRAVGVAAVQEDEFNCMGPFSDAGGRCDELRFIASDDPAMEGAFKTPSLRNVALRPPYMHAGQFATLEDVAAHYAKSPPAAVGHSELAHGAGHAERKPIRLSTVEIADLVAFLRALSGPIVESPMR